MIEYAVANRAGSVRYDRMEGREYLVVPMVMLTEGVFNGSQGPLLYPASELAKIPAIWNHKPIVVYHPDSTSACEPHFLDRRKVGVIMNARYVKGTPGKLRAEAWLEKSRLQQVDPRVLNALESNQPMELSTGLFMDFVDEPGTFNGKAYDRTAKNYRPDHLALLPDGKGACSLADGAGLLLNSQGGDALQVLPLPVMNHEPYEKKVLATNVERETEADASDEYGMPVLGVPSTR